MLTQWKADKHQRGARLSWVFIDIDPEGQPGQSGHALMFVRLPLGQQSPKRRWAVELGLGSNHYLGDWQQMQRLTLSYGREYTSGWGPGWIAVDSTYEQRNRGGDPILKLDATIGLYDPDRPRPMLQLETAKYPGSDLSVTLTPAMQIPMKKDRRLVVGVKVQPGAQRSLGLKVDLWHNF